MSAALDGIHIGEQIIRSVPTGRCR
jgi:hypothetical protein